MPDWGKIAKIAKGVGKKTVTKVNPSEASAVYQKFLPYQVNQKIVNAVGLGVGTVAIGSTVMGEKERKAIGNIEAGEGLSGMTSSVQLSKGVKDFKKGKVRFNPSFTNDSAEGDLVFALHNMR